MALPHLKMDDSYLEGTRNVLAQSCLCQINAYKWTFMINNHKNVCLMKHGTSCQERFHLPNKIANC